MKKKKLKAVLLILLTLTAFSSIIMAQNEKKVKVINKTLKSEVINVSADSLWAILREFDKVAAWTSVLNHSKGGGEAKFEGTTCNKRICETKDNNKVVEELIMFSDERQELAYKLTEGAPGFVKYSKNRWIVSKIGANQSQVQMDVTMHLSRFMGFFLGGLITKEMTKQVTIFLNELKTYAETGEISEAKKEQLEKLENKNK